MGKGKELTEDERAFIVGMAKGGASITKIATETKRSRGTVATILRTFRICGNVKTLKRSGRPSALAKKWGSTISKTVSVRTTRRRLKSLGYNGRLARKKPFISRKNLKKRMEWGKKMKTMTYWKKCFLQMNRK